MSAATRARLRVPSLADTPRFTVTGTYGWVWIRVELDANSDAPWKVLVFGDPYVGDAEEGEDSPQWWSTAQLVDVDAAITHLPQAVAR